MLDRMDRCIAVLALGMAGCVWQTRETVAEARFGFHRPRAVALVIVDGTAPGSGPDAAIPPDLVDAVRFRLRETGVVDLAGERRVPALLDAAGLCAIGRELAAEQVVAVSSTLAFEAHAKCVMFGGTPPPEDDRPFLDKLADDEDTGSRCNTAYDGGTAKLTTTLTVVGVDGCTAMRGAADTLESSSNGGDPAGDELYARKQAVIEVVAKRVRPMVDGLYPAGLEALPPVGGPQAARLDVAGAGAEHLRTGVTYLVRGPREGTHVVVGHVRVAAATPERTTLATDAMAAPPEPGDEVLLETHTHEWKLVPIVGVGDLTADARSSPLVGAGLAARWAYPRLYLTAEVLYSHQAVLDFDEHDRRNDLGVAVGGRPAGAFAPYVIGEAGAAFLPRLRDGDTTYFHSKGFVGVGTGVELSLGSYVLILDARLRRATGFAEGSMSSEVYRERVVQLGFGSRVK